LGGTKIYRGMDEQDDYNLWTYFINALLKMKRVVIHKRIYTINYLHTLC
jgi:hypothetical protein